MKAKGLLKQCPQHANENGKSNLAKLSKGKHPWLARSRVGHPIWLNPAARSDNFEGSALFGFMAPAKLVDHAPSSDTSHAIGGVKLEASTRLDLGFEDEEGDGMEFHQGSDEEGWDQTLCELPPDQLHKPGSDNDFAALFGL